MSIEHGALMRQAQDALAGKWGLAISTFFVFSLLSVVSSIVPFVGTVAGLIIAGPFNLGLSLFTLNLARGREAKIDQIFEGFKNFSTAFAAYLLSGLFILLWSTLLIIPGIIAALSYSQTFFIIADDPSLRAMEAIDKSKAMMDGHKSRLFVLCLIFLGLSLLCLLTLGIGFFWLYPFMSVTLAKFYIDLKETDEEESPGYHQGGIIDQV